MTTKTALVVDSAASLPPDIATNPYVHVVPMQLIFEKRTFLDGRDLSTTEFYRLLAETDRPPTTSAPSPDSFLEAFQAASMNAESIVCLTVSPNFSASFGSAKTAIESARASLPGVRIALVDSQSAAGGEALVATSAIRVIQAGGEQADVLSEIEAVAPKVTLFAFVDTLFYLWKGGRVPRIAHAGASILQIKPMLEMARGEVRTVRRPRTRRRAIQKLLETTKSHVGERRAHVSVTHADAAAEAADLQSTLSDALDCAELFVSEFSPVMGAHIGPGLLGTAFWVE